MSKNDLSPALASISWNVINYLTAARRARETPCWVFGLMGCRTLPILSFAGRQSFIAQATTDFCVMELSVVECYFKGFVHPKTYALLTGSSTCILENIKKLTTAFANGQLSSPP